MVRLPNGLRVRYQIVRTVAEPGLPVGLVAAGVAPRVCYVEGLVEVLFGERWGVN